MLSEIDEADEFGIDVAGAHASTSPRSSARREKVIKTLTGGVAGLFKKNKIDFIEGARLASPTTATSRSAATSTAPRSRRRRRSSSPPARSPSRSPAREFGGRVIGTEEAWALEDAAGDDRRGSAPARRAPRSRPRTARLGTEVLLFEALDRVLPTEDADISKVVGRGFEQAEHRRPHRHAGRERRDRRRQGHVLLRRRDRRGRLARDRRRPRARRRGPRARGGGRQARRPRPDRGRRRAAHDASKGVYAIGDLVPGPALAHKASDEGVIAVEDAAGPGDAPDRVHRHPARDVLHAQRRLVRADRGAGARAGHRRRRRQGPVRRGRRRHRLRRPRRHDQDHRRQEVRRAGRRPHRRRQGDRADPGARQRQGARGRLPRGRRGSSTATRRCPRRVMEAARAADGWLIHG